jgi:hypothetical protein
MMMLAPFVGSNEVDISSTPAEGLLFGIPTVILAGLLGLVAISELRRIRLGKARKEPAKFSPLRQIRLYPRYSLAILAIVFLGGLLAIIQSVYYLVR